MSVNTLLNLVLENQKKKKKDALVAVTMSHEMLAFRILMEATKQKDE